MSDFLPFDVPTFHFTRPQRSRLWAVSAVHTHDAISVDLKFPFPYTLQIHLWPVKAVY